MPLSLPCGYLYQDTQGIYVTPHYHSLVPEHTEICLINNNIGDNKGIYYDNTNVLSSHSELVIPWSTNPLKVTDLASVRLIGLGKSEKRTLDSILPSSVRVRIGIIQYI